MKFKALKRILSVMLALVLLSTVAPISMFQTAFALSDEDIAATVELGKGFNLLAGKTFEAGNLQSAPIFKSMENMHPTKTRLGDVESKMTYITSMSSYLDNTHTDVSVDVSVSTEILLAKTDIKAKFGFKGNWESEGSTNTSRLILEILAKAYKYSMNMNQGNPWEKDEDGNYVTLNDSFADDLMHMKPQAFFNTYGTHIVTQYDAGGEAYTSYEGTDTSNSAKSEWDIETNASVGVSTKKIASVNVEVNASGGEKHENSFANNNQQMSMRVRGGDPMYSTFDQIISGDADETVNNWLASMYGMDENTGSTKSTMIKSDNMQLFAMWDLLAMDKSQSHTVRIEELKKYYMDNVKEELVDMYEEFIYGIPTNFADNYDKINTEIVTTESLDSLGSIPSGYTPIRTERDLMKMGDAGNYILLNDIELSEDFLGVSVGNGSFSGVFDGNGHTISGYEKTVTTNSSVERIGLFPAFDGKIKNLILKDIHFTVNAKEGHKVYAGILGGDAATYGIGLVEDVRIEDSSIIVKGESGQTYVGGVAGYTDSSLYDNGSSTRSLIAIKRATVKNCVIKSERPGSDALVGAGGMAIGGITGYHTSEGGYAFSRSASYNNDISATAGYVGGCVGYANYQVGSSNIFSAYNTCDNGYAGYIKNTENANYDKIYVMGDEDFACGSELDILEKCAPYLSEESEKSYWTYTGAWGEDLPEPVFNKTYPYLIVHAPGGITAFKDATLGTNDITVYFAPDIKDAEGYEDVTDFVNYFYDFSEPGTTTVAAVYGNKTIEFEVEVQEPVITEANIISTGKTEYKSGEIFDIEDFVAQIVYSNCFTENLFKGNSEFVVTIPALEGDTPVVPGEYVLDYEIDSAEVIIKYGDTEFTYNISVSEPDPEGKIQFTSPGVKITSGEDFTLDVYMRNNPGIVALRASVEFDESMFELKGVTNKANFEKYEDSKDTDDQGNDVYDSPYKLYWSNPYTNENNTTINGELISFNFKIKETDDFTDRIIKFNFIEAFDKDGNRIGGVSSKFNIDVCDIKVGDVDGSDRVNAWDAVLLKKHFFDTPNDKLFMDAADVNYDGYKDDLDSTYLNRYVVGLYGIYGLDGTPGKYNVTFTGKGFEEYTRTMTVGDELLAPPVADANSFHGWYDNPEFEGNALTKLPIRTGSKITLYAKVGYPINYDNWYTDFDPEEYINFEDMPRWYYCDAENPFGPDDMPQLEAEGLKFREWTFRVKGHNIAVPEGGFTTMPGELTLIAEYDGTEYDIYVRAYVPGLVDVTEKVGTYKYEIIDSFGTRLHASTYAYNLPDIKGYSVEYKIYDNIECTGSGSNYVLTPLFGKGKPGDLYLYFKYVPVQTNVSFDWNFEGAPEIEGLTHTYDATEFSLPTAIPERSGYTFSGWKMEYTVGGSDVRTEKVSTTYYGKEWRAPGSNVKFIAQWTAETSSATISLVNPLTGVTERVTFDTAQDYTMPAGDTNLVVVNGAYYKFDGWYASPDYIGEPVTVIPANTFDIANSKYYSKWIEAEKVDIVVHDKNTEEVIDTITVDAGSVYTFPDATEYVKALLGNDYVSGGNFYTKSGTTYTEVTSLTADFSKINVYVDVYEASNVIENIFTVSNYNYAASTKQLGVEIDGAKYLFDEVSGERVYRIYTPADKIKTINVLEQAYVSSNDYADVKYRAEYCGTVIEEERVIRYSSSKGGLDNVIYSPIIKDEYTLDLYIPTYSTHTQVLSEVYKHTEGELAGIDAEDEASIQKISGLNLMDGYPVTVQRGEKVTLPVLGDIPAREYGDAAWLEHLNNSGLSEEEISKLNMKFVGWFERPYYSKKNEQPITEIDTNLIGQDIQLYAIFEPEALLTYGNGLVGYVNGIIPVFECRDYKVSVIGEDVDITKFVYVISRGQNEIPYDTSLISEGRLVKAMPKVYSEPYLVKGTCTTAIQIRHPFGTNSYYTYLYDGTTVYNTGYVANQSSPDIEYVYVGGGGYKPYQYGLPDPTLED